MIVLMAGLVCLVIIISKTKKKRLLSNLKTLSGFMQKYIHTSYMQNNIP